MFGFFKRNLLKSHAAAILKNICSARGMDFRVLGQLNGWHGVSEQLMHLYEMEVAPIKRVTGELPDREVGALLLVVAFGRHLSTHNNYLLNDATSICLAIEDTFMTMEGVVDVSLIRELKDKYSVGDESGAPIFSKPNEIAFSKIDKHFKDLNENITKFGGDDLPRSEKYTHIKERLV